MAAGLAYHVFALDARIQLSLSLERARTTQLQRIDSA